MMDWRRVGMSFTVIVPTVALLAFGLTRDPRVLHSVLPGKKAPDFALAVMETRGDPDGPRIARLADHRGEIVILNFWASWCLACRSEHASLSRIAARYEGQGVHFYGAVYNDSPGNAERYIRTMGGQTYPSLMDPGSRIAIDYGVAGVPETFFIGPDGIVAHKQIGPVNDAILVEWIERLKNPAVEAR
jgi:cytochrome c biogenesis protein CcmG, thiol:disulfide interchange protein DsbE